MSTYSDTKAYWRAQNAARFRRQLTVTVLTPTQDAEVAAALAITQRVIPLIQRAKDEYREQQHMERVERIRKKFAISLEEAE